jgi:hypothetical protein
LSCLFPPSLQTFIDVDFLYTPRKILKGKIYGSLAEGKPKDRWVEAVPRDTRKLLGTEGWKMWGRKMK